MFTQTPINTFLQEECEDMWYEETIQRSADRYCEAVERKLDYQW